MNRTARVVVSAPFAMVVLPAIALLHPIVHGTPLDGGALDGLIQAVTNWCYGVIAMNAE